MVNPLDKKSNRLTSSSNALPNKLENNLDYVAGIYLQAKQLETHNQRYKVRFYQILQYTGPAAQLLLWGVALFLVIVGTKTLVDVTDARSFCAQRESLESCQNDPWVQRSPGENTRVIFTRLLALGLMSGGLYLVIRLAKYLQEVMVGAVPERNFWQKELELYSSQRNLEILHAMRSLLKKYPYLHDQSSEREYLIRSRELLEKLKLVPYDGAEHEARLQMQCQANIREIKTILESTKQPKQLPDADLNLPTDSSREITANWFFKS